MLNQTEQPSLYEQIKTNYKETLILLKELNEKKKDFVDPSKESVKTNGETKPST